MMFNSMKNTRALGLLAVLLFAVVIAPSAQSLPYGVSGVENDGCSCHGQSASSDVVPTIEGLPDELEGGATYALNISFTGGPSYDNNPGALALGGFHLWASAGTLTPVDDKVKSNPDGSVTHNGLSLIHI